MKSVSPIFDAVTAPGRVECCGHGVVLSGDAGAELLLQEPVPFDGLTKSVSMGRQGQDTESAKVAEDTSPGEMLYTM